MPQRERELCAAHDIPLPETQVWIGEHRADFVWHDVGLIVETGAEVVDEPAVVAAEVLEARERLRSRGRWAPRRG